MPYFVNHGHTDPFITLQMVLLATLHWTADGLVSVCVQTFVEAEPRPELAAALRLRMAARIVLVTGRRCATRKAVQVRRCWRRYISSCIYLICCF